jgi:hypothetical protein
MQPLELMILDGELTVHRFPAASKVPPAVLERAFYSISRTEDELSIVCQSDLTLTAQQYEPGWRALQVKGPLDFSLVGILAALATSLAQAGISVFAISTFDTDYLLVKHTELEPAASALRAAGHQVVSAG